LFFSESQKNKPNKSFVKKLKPFIIDNIEYMTLNEASKKIDVNYLTIRHRLLSEKFENYFYITNEEQIEKLKNKLAI